MNKTRIALLTVLLGLHAAAAMAQVALPGGPTPGAQSNLPPGLYVQVIDGMIHVTNPAGSQNFAAGQFGFTPINQPPVVVPKNPGLIFTPPPAFNTSSPTNTASSGGKSNTVDCEVR